MTNFTRTLTVCLTAALPAAAGAQVPLTGVNLAGAEFGGRQGLPGEYGKHYTYPQPAEVDYFISQGMNTFRIPFKWERLQRSLFGPFDETEFSRLDGLVRHATAQGAYVVLDPHNYARYHGTVIGTGDVPNEAFADFWKRLAEAYKDDQKVLFNLINEPYSIPSTEHWVETANLAIAAIREAGATNLILVPGNAWSGAHSWLSNHYGTPNGVALLEIVDPANNFAFDVHQYLDSDSSGTKDVIVSPTIGVERLVKFTEWARQHGHRGFLGEFAVANAQIGDGAEQIGDEALDAMLQYMADNSDVWLGWTWWAAGPWWNNYMFTLHPIDFGKPTQTDRPVMPVLQRHLAGVTAAADETPAP